MMNLVSLKNKLQLNIDSVDVVLQKFKARFDENPTEALSWGETVFNAAATQLVGQTILSWIASAEDSDKNLSPDEIFQMMKDQITRVVLHGARYPEHSSSACSNMMKTEVVAAYATILEDMKW